MHKVKIILLAMLLPFVIKAQVVFKTIVPKQPVAVGESFPVQYVVEDIQTEDAFSAPPFDDFRLVSGPDTYSGSAPGIDGSKRLKNIVFTLMALKPGRFLIPGATANVNGKFLKSNDAYVEVISKTEALEKLAKQAQIEIPSEYFLRPGEDPYEKIRKNLFMKVLVDKKTCYVGEPVVATFKLYSRLESKSDIVKNPGFYGFAVQDMIGLTDNIVNSETINGKSFDVHIVRTVQLYPLQAGQFTIDAMEVMNKVEFSKSVINKKTEQEVIEGVHNNDSYRSTENTIIYESSISTERIPILVKPYPEKNRPILFNGATGNFTIDASLEKPDLDRNEEGAFIITIRGKGNFTQIAAPSIQWPDGIESFEPAIKDSLDKTRSPLHGSRSFRYSFLSAKTGNYSIPAVSLSFFDPDSNKYKTISAKATGVKINYGEIKEEPKKAEPAKAGKKGYQLLWVSGAVLLLISLVIIVWLRKKRNEALVKKTPPPTTETTPSLDQLLQPAQFSLVADDGRFYHLLQKSIWEYLAIHLKLSGSKMNKHELYAAMKEKKINEDVCQGILEVLRQCEVSLFTKADLVGDKEELLGKTRIYLERLGA